MGSFVRLFDFENKNLQFDPSRGHFVSSNLRRLSPVKSRLELSHSLHIRGALRWMYCMFECFLAYCTLKSTAKPIVRSIVPALPKERRVHLRCLLCLNKTLLYQLCRSAQKRRLR